MNAVIWRVRAARRTAVGLIAVLANASPCVAQCRYEVTILEAEPCILAINGISGTGFVAGLMMCPGFPKAFFWPGEGEPIPLPMPSGSRSIAEDVNGDGLVVGCYSSGNGDRGFVWDGAETRNLGVLPDHNWSEALAINEDGVIVGFSMNVQTGPKLPVAWINEELIDLSLLFGPFDRGTAYDVNDLGQVSGRYRPTQESRHGAFLLDLNTGETVVIGAVPGSDEGEGRAVNNRGHVMVVGDDLKSGEPKTFLWKSGQMIDLGLLPGDTRLIGADINDRGLVVGSSRGADRVSVAVVWQNGQLSDLNDLVSAEGIRLEAAWAINNAGVIVGGAVFDDPNVHGGVLLTPIGMPAGDVTGDCRVDFTDLLVLLSEWGPCIYCIADLDNNGTVDFNDLLILLASWS